MTSGDRSLLATVAVLFGLALVIVDWWLSPVCTHRAVWRSDPSGALVPIVVERCLEGP